MSNRRFRFLLVLLLTLFLPASTLAAEPRWRTIQPTGFVTDAANLLTPEERATFEADLDQYRRETSNEISVVILSSLEGTPIADVALDLGRRFRVGTTKNNGVILLVALQEREIRLEVGYGLEGAVPDATSKRIIAEVMVPKFREGKFGEGIRDGVSSLQMAISGSGDTFVVEPWGESRFPLGSILVLLLWLTVIFGGFLAVTRSWWLGGVLGGVLGLLLTALTTSWLFIPALIVYGLGIDYFFSRFFPRQFRRGGMWLGGPGGGGRSSGGGFGGFGGGSFGGGGAGGKW